MTREHKLALIIGFTLVLVVGVLISDHFSKAHEARLRTEMPETPARNLAADGLRPVGAGSSGGGGGGGSIFFGPAPAAARPPPRGPETALPPVTEPALMPQGGEDRSIVMGGRWSTPPEESGQISVPLPGRFEPYTPGPNSTLWNGTVRPIGEPDQPGQTPGAPPALGGGRDGVRIVRPDGPVIEPPRGEQPASVPPALATREEMVNGVPLRMMKRHDVREGESLYGITRQAYGDGSLWNKVAEYNKGKVMANGSVREGVTLLLPPKEALLGRQLPASAGTPAAPSPAPARKVEPSGTRPSDNSGGRSGASAAPRTYTVQRGDVLSEVARKTLGSSKRWTEILALNSDTLDDGDTLVAGMVLKLPAR